MYLSLRTYILIGTYGNLIFPGIFQPHIHYLLVLATPVDVVILGLSFPKAQAGQYGSCFFFLYFNSHCKYFTVSHTIQNYKLQAMNNINKNVFISIPQHKTVTIEMKLLCLHVSNLSAGLNDSMSGAMQLLPDPLYSIPTDNTYMLAISSTDLGRIFLAGKDGCLYEIAYQAEAGWFSQRCKKINHSKSSLSFLIPSLLQFSFSEDGKNAIRSKC